MTIYIWTQADAQNIRQVFTPAIADTGIAHKVIPFGDELSIPRIGKGDVLLACGNKARDAIEALGLIKKKSTVGYNREKPIPYGEGHIFLTYDPGLANIDYARVPEMQWDCQLAIRFHNTGSTQPAIGKYEWVECLQFLIDDIKARYERTGKPVYMACDTETMGLNEYAEGVRILSISFTIDSGESWMLYFGEGEKPVAPPPWKSEEDMDYWEGLWNQINWLLTTEMVASEGANWKYDHRWIQHHWGIDCTNHKFDTLLVGSLLDENRSNSLKLHGKIMTPMGGYEDGMDKYDMGHLEVVPKEELGNYMGGDTDVTHQCAAIMRKELVRDKALTNFYTKLLRPSSEVFRKMEQVGICVDVDYYDRLETEIEAEQARLRAEMVALCPQKLKHKYADNFSFTRPVIIKDLFFSSIGYNLKPLMVTEKSGEPSTAHDHLMMFADVPEAKAFVDKLSELNSANKTLSTYVRGFRKHLRSDGRFHPHYMLFKGDYNDDSDSGTDTGRTSCKDPAAQCQIGSSLVYTERGNLTLLSMVEGFERGERYRVLTHTGQWRDVVGVYRNGVKKVYRVTTKSGKMVTCTSNHPLLSEGGFIRTDHALVGDFLFTLEGWHAAAEVRFDRDGVREIESLRVQQGNQEVEVPMRVRENSLGVWSDAQKRENEVLRVLSSRATDEAWAGQQEEHFASILGVVSHEAKVPETLPEGQEVLPEGGHVRPLDGFRELPCGYGGAAERNFAGPFPQQGGGLRAGQLPLGYAPATIEEHQGQRDGVLQRTDEVRFGVGAYHGAQPSHHQCPIEKRVERDSGTHHASEAADAGYALDEIACIEFVGEEETYDLTIDRCHSFVCNGVVVHNTIPKHTKWTKKLRRAFIAPPGHTILQLDFSQGELRIAACLAKETNMIDAYLAGKDLHAVTGAKLAGYSFEDFLLLPDDVRDPFRSRAKAGNFGLLYGMGAEGFQAYALSSYGVKMSLQEAEAARDAFFDLYSRLPEWHTECKNHAKRWGSIRSPLGRIRHLPLINSRDRQAASKAGRNAVNSPVQSCLSDMMQYAMVLMDREYPGLQFTLMTHDSIAIYVPTEEATIWAKRLKSIMDNLPLKKEFGWDHQLPFVADAEVAEYDVAENVASLATLKKLKVLA